MSGDRDPESPTREQRLPEPPAGSAWPPPLEFSSESGDETDERGPAGRLAITALALGITGIVVPAAICGVLALVRIARQGGAGRGMALTGVVLSGIWTVVLLAGAALMMVDEAPGAGDASSRNHPRPGECFVAAPAGAAGAKPTVVPCDRPHQGQVILHFELADGAWPGGEEIDQRARAGCGQRLFALFKTRSPAGNTVPGVLVPARTSWRLGFRKVACVLRAESGTLSTRIEARDTGRRLWSELAIGACFDTRRAIPRTVRVLPCGKPHRAQLTHRATLPTGPWAGRAVTGRRALRACQALWRESFARRPAPIPFKYEYLHPTQQEWSRNDRTVHCYVTGTNGHPLHRSLTR